MKNINKVVLFFAARRKALVAFGVFVTQFIVVLEDDIITTEEWWILGMSFAGIFGVHQATNLVGAVYRKK